MMQWFLCYDGNLAWKIEIQVKGEVMTLKMSVNSMMPLCRRTP
jgi:hypothetical protein